MQKGNIQILIIVILAAVVGYFVYTNYSNNQTKTVPVQTTQTSSPTGDPMANWKTYTNDDQGYSIKYPSNWEMEPWCFGGSKDNQYICLLSPDFEYNPGQNPVKQGGSVSVGYMDASVGYGYNKNQFCDSTISPATPILDCKEIMVGSLKGLQRDFGVFTDAGVLRDGKIVFSFRVNYIEGSKENISKTFDQILSTFKFTQ